MKPWLWGYGAALLVLGALDAVWLGVIAKGFYQREFGDLMAPEFRVAPAVLFYLAYPAALLALAFGPQPAGTMAWSDALWRSALVGLLAYGTYDLTNMATLRHWSLRLVITDVIWGVCITTAAGAAAFWAMKRFSG